jgi:hypothetical protein
MKIVLPDFLFNSAEKYDRIQGVLDFVNLMLESHYYPEELPRAALEAYYVDFYLDQVNAGGISKFVHASRWDSELTGLVESGLNELRATAHAAFWRDLESEVRRLDAVLPAFFDGDHFNESHPAREQFDALNDAFFAANAAEPLAELNYTQLGKLECVLVLPKDAYLVEMKRLMDSVPDLERRRAASINPA